MTVPDDGFRHRQVTVGGSGLHVIEAGDPDGVPVLFLHGWPQSWWAWRHVMVLAAADGCRAVALDLPGVGGSNGDPTDGSKQALAAVVHELVSTLDLAGATLVGQDVGGMIAYPYLRTWSDVARTVIMDVVIPGVEPWEEVLRNPYIWHFAMHAIPELPERLVQGRQAEYFDYFFDVLSRDPGRISAEDRAVYQRAYATDNALTAGFNWYRTFSRDAADNRRLAEGPATDTPLLYLRGEYEGGDLDTYVRGLREAGVTRVESARVPDGGHFTQEEAPEATWRLIGEFIGL